MLKRLIKYLTPTFRDYEKEANEAKAVLVKAQNEVKANKEKLTNLKAL